MSSWKDSVLPASTSAIMAASSLALAGDCIRSPVASVGWLGIHVLLIFACNESVEGELAGAKGKDEDSGSEEGISVRFIELFRVAEEGEECFALRSPKRYEHGTAEQKSNRTREEPED